MEENDRRNRGNGRLTLKCIKVRERLGWFLVNWGVDGKSLSNDRPPDFLTFTERALRGMKSFWHPLHAVMASSF